MPIHRSPISLGFCRRGGDQAKFTLSSDGVLAFASAKDFESPDDANRDGSYEVTVQVTDGKYPTLADLTMTLSNVNEAPTANAGPNQTNVQPGTTLTLSGSGSDPDQGESDTLSYLWTQTGQETVTLTGADTATATFTVPSGLSTDAVLTFRLRVTDASGLSHEDTVSVTALDAIPLTAVFEKAPRNHDGRSRFSMDLRFSENVKLAFGNGLLTITGGRLVDQRRLVWLDSTAWQIDVRPDDHRDVVVTLPANRDCDQNAAPCTLDERQLSAPASVTVTGPIAPQFTGRRTFVAEENQTAVDTLTATDADTPAADLTWSISTGASGGKDRGKFTLSSDGVLAFASAKDFENPDDSGRDGSYEVTVKVSDGVQTDTANLTVTLSNVNDAPTANAGADQPYVLEGATVTLSG